MNSQHAPAQSEWLKVMLGEVARKREEAELGRAEEDRRRQEGGQPAASAAPAAKRPAGKGRRR